MDKIIALNTVQDQITVLTNTFIDEYMPRADGEYVKVYLLILRLQSSQTPVDVERIADCLELTQKDVLRALSYWQNAGLLRMDSEDTRKNSDVSAGTALSDMPTGSTPGTVPLAQQEPSGTAERAVVPEKTVLTPGGLKDSMKDTDLERTIYMAETYLGRPFSSTELNSFCYISDQLHFSPDLMEYLIEYCVTRGKTSVRYIESVAINWYQQGIHTVKEAKEQSTLYTQNVYPVMKAFGISNRDPGSAELDYIKQWNSLGFEPDIIIEACSRTLLATHQASFPYANKILKEWKRLGVRNSSDIKILDEKRRSAAASSYAAGTSRKKEEGDKRTAALAANPFHNFEQRTYDYQDLESRLLDKNRR